MWMHVGIATGKMSNLPGAIPVKRANSPSQPPTANNSPKIGEALWTSALSYVERRLA